MVRKVDGVNTVTLVNSAFLMLLLVDGLKYNNNTLPFTLGVIVMHSQHND
jgi:hypothetical protein